LLSVKPVLSLFRTEAIKRAVIAGLGVAIVPRLAISLELQRGLLAMVPLKDLPIVRPLHLQTVQGQPPTPAAAWFLELLAPAQLARAPVSRASGSRWKGTREVRPQESPDRR
jgi:LysR family transcriptional regulator, putative pyruvate carboxylase regulator